MSAHSSLKKIELLHASLKPDFLQRLLFTFQSNKGNKGRLTEFQSIILSRNPIEDKGALSLAALFKEFPKMFNLTELSLSKCSLSSKSVNSLFMAGNFSTTLKILDLSYNSLKEEPSVISIYFKTYSLF